MFQSHTLKDLKSWSRLTL